GERHRIAAWLAPARSRSAAGAGVHVGAGLSAGQLGSVLLSILGVQRFRLFRDGRLVQHLRDEPQLLVAATDVVEPGAVARAGSNRPPELVCHALGAEPGGLRALAT